MYIILLFNFVVRSAMTLFAVFLSSVLVVFKFVVIEVSK
jgi:hypothetical protein